MNSAFTSRQNKPPNKHVRSSVTPTSLDSNREIYGAFIGRVTRNLPFDSDNILKRMVDPETKFEDDADRKTGFQYYRGKKTGRWIKWPRADRGETKAELCNYLNSVAEKVRFLLGKPRSPDDLVFSTKYTDRGLPPGLATNLVPDIVVIHREKTHTGEGWSGFRSFVSFKASSQPKLDEQMQLGACGRVCFASQLDRRYVLALGFLHKKLTLYVADRSGFIYSPEYDIDKHPQLFLRLAIGILFMDQSQLGYDTSFSLGPDGRYLSVEGDKHKLEGVLHTDRSLPGRGTVCFKTRCVAGKNAGKVCVVKDAWVDRTMATKEVEMLKFLRSRVKNTPALLSGGVVTIPGASGSIVDSTDIFREQSARTEIRDHYRIVMTPFGEPISKFASLTELVSATLDIIETIEALDKIGVLHRDISLANIILVNSDTGFREGYLIDFDSAIHKKDIAHGGTTSKGKRAGTVPFMSVSALLNETEHIAICDAESTLYLLTWIAFAQSGPLGQSRPNYDFNSSIISQWNAEGQISEDTFLSLGYSKSDVLHSSKIFDFLILAEIDKYFLPLHDCLRALRKVFFPPPSKQQPDRDVDDMERVAQQNLDRYYAKTKRCNTETFEELKSTLKTTKGSLKDYEVKGVSQTTSNERRTLKSREPVPQELKVADCIKTSSIDSDVNQADEKQTRDRPPVEYSRRDGPHVQNHEHCANQVSGKRPRTEDDAYGDLRSDRVAKRVEKNGPRREIDEI